MHTLERTSWVVTVVGQDSVQARCSDMTLKWTSIVVHNDDYVVAAVTQSTDVKAAATWKSLKVAVTVKVNADPKLKPEITNYVYLFTTLDKVLTEKISFYNAYSKFFATQYSAINKLLPAAPKTVLCTNTVILISNTPVSSFLTRPTEIA